MLMETSKNPSPSSSSTNNKMDQSLVINNPVQSQSPSTSSSISTTPSPSSSSSSTVTMSTSSSVICDTSASLNFSSLTSSPGLCTGFSNRNNSSSFNNFATSMMNNKPSLVQQNNYNQDLFEYNNSIGSPIIFDPFFPEIKLVKNPNQNLFGQPDHGSYFNQNNFIYLPAQNKFQHNYPNQQLMNKIVQQSNRNSKNLKSSNSSGILNKNMQNKNKISGSSNQTTKNFASSKNLWNKNSSSIDKSATTTSQCLPASTMMNNGLFSSNNHHQQSNNWLSSATTKTFDEHNGTTNNHQNILNNFSSLIDSTSMLHSQSSSNVPRSLNNNNSKLCQFNNLMCLNGSEPQMQHQQNNHIIDSTMMFLNSPDIYNSLVQNDHHDHHDSSTTTSNVSRSLFSVWSGSGTSETESLIMDPLLTLGSKSNHQSDSRSTNINNQHSLDNNSVWLDHCGSSTGSLSTSDNLQSTTPVMSTLLGNVPANNLDRIKQLLLDFYHDNLKYFINEDLQVTKIMLDFYLENFSRSSTSGSTTSIHSNNQNQTSNLNSLEIEQIILNRLLSRKSNTNTEDISEDLRQFDEFANIYYDLQEHERGSQYLDKVWLQSKFEDLKKLYTLMFTSGGNETLSSNGLNLDSSIVIPSSTPTSLDQNNNTNNQNYNQTLMIEEKLKQLKMETKQLHKTNNAQTFQIIMLRLLKYYKKLFNMIPKEILLNILLINQLAKNDTKNPIDDISDESDSGEGESDSCSKLDGRNHHRQLQQYYRRFMTLLRQMTNNQHILPNHHNSNHNQNNIHNNNSTEPLQQKKDKKKKNNKSNQDATGHNNKNRKIKIFDHFIGIKLETSIYFPHYYPMSADNLNICGPIMVFFNRPSKPSKTLIGHMTHNWNMIESIEHEVHKSGTQGALVLERSHNNNTNDGMGQSGTDNSPTSMPTSMSKLLNRLKVLFPNISTNQLIEIIRQAKYILMKRYKIQYGFSGFKIGQLVKFISELIIENGISSSTTNNNETNKTTVIPIINSTSNVTKGISWSKIAAQNNNNSNTTSTSISTTAISKDHSSGSGVGNTMISPIMKPTPSSTPLSSSSSSSLSSSSNNQNNSTNYNFSKTIQNTTTSSSNVTSNDNHSTTSGLNVFSINSINETNNNTNSCALCKNIIHDITPANNKNNSQIFRFTNTTNKGGFRMPQCKHLFHKECFENLTTSSPSNTTTTPIGSMTNNNNNSCPICEKLFILRKDEFPSLI